MPTRALVLGLCLVVATHATAKPPDLPLPVRPDLAPEERVIETATPPTEEEQQTPAVEADCCPLVSFYRTLAMPIMCGPFGTNLWTAATPEKIPVAPKVTNLDLAKRYFLMAEFCRKVGFADDACDCYMSVCELYPGTRMAAFAAARFESLCAECAVGGEELADKDDQKEAGCPRLAGVFEKAECCMHQGDIETACKLYEEIVRQCPDERLGKIAGERLKSLRGLRKQSMKRTPAAVPHVFAAYDLSDLICEVAGNNIRNSIGELTTAHELKRYIIGHIHPGSWEGHGGKGGIEYNAETNSLVIRHGEGVQHEVTALLANLRTMHHAGRTPITWLTRKNRTIQSGDAEEASADGKESEPAPSMVTMGHDLNEMLVGMKQTDAVVAEITRAIEKVSPQSWQQQGGSGRMSYNDELKCFFIVNTPEVHEAIRELLEIKAREIKRRGDEERQEPRSDASSVDRLLQACQTALRKDHRSEAMQWANRALALDRKAVMAHPFVYKMQLLSQVFAEHETLKPRMPGVDPNVIRAYSEILDKCPKHNNDVCPAVLKATDDECELELVPAVCAEKDGNRLRFQMQLAGWTIKLVDEGKGKTSLTIGLPCFAVPK